MEPVTILNSYYDIYWEKTLLNIKDLNNKLFCTFVSEDALDDMVSSIAKAYSIMYNKMFVLFVKSTGEYVVTYNVEQGNVNNIDRKSTRLNSSHSQQSRMPSSA